MVFLVKDTHRECVCACVLGRACVQQREKERASERATSRTGVSELRFHAVSLADSEMDVRFFPAPPSSVGSCTLPTDSGLDYYHPNKVTHLCFFLSTLLRCGKCAELRGARCAQTDPHRVMRKRAPCMELCGVHGRRSVASAALLDPSGGGWGLIGELVCSAGTLQKHLLRARARDIPFLVEFDIEIN